MLDELKKCVHFKGLALYVECWRIGEILTANGYEGDDIEDFISTFRDEFYKRYDGIHVTVSGKPKLD